MLVTKGWYMVPWATERGLTYSSFSLAAGVTTPAGFPAKNHSYGPKLFKRLSWQDPSPRMDMGLCQAKEPTNRSDLLFEQSCTGMPEEAPDAINTLKF
jgi:hypothetical protein